MIRVKWICRGLGNDMAYVSRVPIVGEKIILPDAWREREGDECRTVIEVTHIARHEETGLKTAALVVIA